MSLRKLADWDPVRLISTQGRNYNYHIPLRCEGNRHFMTVKVHSVKYEVFICFLLSFIQYSSKIYIFVIIMYFKQFIHVTAYLHILNIE